MSLDLSADILASLIGPAKAAAAAAVAAQGKAPGAAPGLPPVPPAPPGGPGAQPPPTPRGGVSGGGAYAQEAALASPVGALQPQPRRGLSPRAGGGGVLLTSALLDASRTPRDFGERLGGATGRRAGEGAEAAARGGGGAGGAGAVVEGVSSA